MWEKIVKKKTILLRVKNKKKIKKNVVRVANPKVKFQATQGDFKDER